MQSKAERIREFVSDGYYAGHNLLSGRTELLAGIDAILGEPDAPSPPANWQAGYRQALADAAENIRILGDAMPSTEPDPPASDAGAEIVAMLRATAIRVSGGLGGASLACQIHADAERILARHQTRRVVRVELTEEVWRDVSWASPYRDGDMETMRSFHAFHEAVIQQHGEWMSPELRAQHPQPAGGA